MFVVLFQSGHTRAIMACCLLGCPVAHKEQETHDSNSNNAHLTKSTDPRSELNIRFELSQECSEADQGATLTDLLRLPAAYHCSAVNYHLDYFYFCIFQTA